VAETDHHDKWQRATLLVALVGDSTIGDRADEIQRFVDARFPDGASYRRTLRSTEDLSD
jgi:uncharacterized protein